MELARYTNVLLKWWWLIVASVIVATISSYLGVRATPGIYQSRTTLMVGQALQNPNPSESEFYTGQVLAQSYADLARREPVLKSTLEALQLPWDWTVLQGMVTSRVIPGTQLLEISVLDTNPRRAQVLASEIAQQLISHSPAATDPQKEAERQFALDQVKDLKANIKGAQDEIRQLDDEIAKSTSARQIQDASSRQAALQQQVSTWQATFNGLLTNLQQGTPNFLSVVEPAQVPTAPVGPGGGYTVLLAVVIAVGLSGGAAFLIEYLDDTLKTPDDVLRVLGLATLAKVGWIDGQGYPDKLVTAKQPRSPVAAAYRSLRTNLHFGAVDHPVSTLMVTSPGPKEGKSLVAANLAVAVAQSGKRVILVDADLWRPTLHHIFERNNASGLTTVLLQSDANSSVTLQPGSVENLSLLLSGSLPPNPTDLLGSQRMGNLIEALKQQTDLVIFDSPPVMVDADAVILARRVDSVLLVVDAASTRQPNARRCKEALTAVGAYIAGVILNRSTARESRYYYYAQDERRKGQLSAREPLARQTGLAVEGKAWQPTVSVTFTDSPSPKVLPSVKPRPSEVFKRTEEVAAQKTAQEAIFRAARKPAGVYQRRDVRAGTVGTQRKSAPMSQNKAWLRWAIIGAVSVLVLIAALASSLTGRSVQQVGDQATAPATATQVRVVQATTKAVVTAPLESTPLAAAMDIASAQSAVVQPEATISIAPAQDIADATLTPQATSTVAGMPSADATATQQAINAVAARQAVGFLGCDVLDFEVLKSPVDAYVVSAKAVNVELIWRVRNKATPTYCKWGQAGQEVKLLRAIPSGTRLGTGIPVKLKWIQTDEYDLSVSAQATIGSQTLSWRLTLPGADQAAGPALEAKVSVIVPTPKPTATLVPTPTSCPQVTYKCNCKTVCSGRDCSKECDQCTEERCD
jgi:succinoglycan biosynthesis transport protein ExoP